MTSLTHDDGFFARIREWGFQPRTILDVGANQGNWAKDVWANFGAGSPEPPRLLMVEGSSGRIPDLNAAGFPFVISVVGPESRYVEFFDNPNAHTGNSVLKERTNHFSAIVPTRVPMRTLDDLIAAAPGGPSQAPALLKLDVQGFELEVLKGAAATIATVEVAVLETSVIEYNAGSPLVAEVMSAMHALGFVVLDMLEVHHHNGALNQLDFAFVKRDSKLLLKSAEKAQLV